MSMGCGWDSVCQELLLMLIFMTWFTKNINERKSKIKVSWLCTSEIPDSSIFVHLIEESLGHINVAVCSAFPDASEDRRDLFPSIFMHERKKIFTLALKKDVSF